MDMNKYKKQLMEEKRKLDRLIVEMQDNTLFGDTTHHTNEKYASGELSSYDNHIGDLGTDVFMQDMQNSLTTHEKGRAYQIDKALSKIEDGSYGICEICNKKIDEDRLDILPETSLCTNCAKKHDNLPTINEQMDLNFRNSSSEMYSDYITNLTDLNKTRKFDDDEY